MSDTPTWFVWIVTYLGEAILLLLLMGAAGSGYADTIGVVAGFLAALRYAWLRRAVVLENLPPDVGEEERRYMLRVRGLLYLVVLGGLAVTALVWIGGIEDRPASFRSALSTTGIIVYFGALIRSSQLLASRAARLAVLASRRVAFESRLASLKRSAKSA